VKNLPPPAASPDLTELLRSRHANPPEVPAPAPAPEPPAASRPKAGAMDRRSWYMPRESADALAAAVEELHFTTRQPKHAVLAALVAVALDNLEDAQRRIQ